MSDQVKQRLIPKSISLSPEQWSYLETHIKALNKDRQGDDWNMQELFRHVVSEYIKQQEKAQ